VTNDRRQRILSRIAESDDSSTDRLCSVCMDVTATSGVGIMLRSDDVTHGSFGMTDAVSSFIEELQFMLGEGPCIDAYNLAIPIAEPDLADPTSRWLGFSPPVFEAGVRALFAFPLRVGAVRLGSLNLYRDHPGALSDDQHADALIMADVFSEAVLTMQPGAAPDELADQLDAVMTPLNVVHQAVGMVSAQLGVSVDTSLIRLKAHAFANDRLLTELSQDVLARRLRFDAAGEAQDVTP
jgi:GAF domain-containing protein